MAELSLYRLNENLNNANSTLQDQIDGKLGKNETATDALKVNGLTVETAVPVGAKFTDTVTTINGKSGTIAKADLVTVIGAVDTVNSGLMSAADKVKLNSVTAGAAPYTHPTGDGNLHIPATSTTNNGKVLKAGATAGSLVWGSLTATDVGAATSAHNHAGVYEPVDTNIMKKNVAQTMGAQLVAQANVNYTTAQVRNIILSTGDPTGGSNGDVWIKYTP